MKLSEIRNFSKSICKIENPIECNIVQRINRFVVEVQIEKKRYRAAINNTGRLSQFLLRRNKAFCLNHKKPGKTDFKLLSIMDGDQAAIVDTQLQMRAFERSLEMGLIPWLSGYDKFKRNAKLGSSLIDYLLEGGGPQLYLEAKSAVLRERRYAMYPDCPSARGRKHILELTEYVKKGGKVVILFIAALPNVEMFKPYKAGDPELFELLIKSHQAGVEIRSIGMSYHPTDSSIYVFVPDLNVEPL